MKIEEYPFTRGKSSKKTFLTMEDGRTYTARDIAEKTGRHRAIESAILNKLFSLGVVGKKRVKKGVYYFRRE